MPARHAEPDHYRPNDSPATTAVCRLVRIPCDMNVDELARKFIELCCGAHSVKMLYRFLLKANNYTEEAAREEFVTFLRGELSKRLLDDTRRWGEDCRLREGWRPHGNPQTPGIMANGEDQAGVGAVARLLMFPRPSPADFARRAAIPGT
jgi:hypothetical protein